MSTEGNETTAVDTQGDLRASHNAADAFNNFADTIESVVAAALAQAGLGVMSPWQDIPLSTSFGPSTDPEGMPLEAPVPADGEVNPTEQLNQVKETANNAQESAAEGIRRANTAQSTANSALAKALSAMSVAQQARSIARSANTSAVADSDAETPPYVSNGGGPQ